MRQVIGAAVAAMGIWAGAAQAAPAPLMKVLIAPGPMDETINKGEVRITITVPGVDAPAGASLFNRPNGTDLKVSDSQGPVEAAPPPPAPPPSATPVAAGPGRGPGGGRGPSRAWIPTRAVKGDLVVSYVLPVSNTATNGGTTPINPRIDGKGFSAIGSTLLPSFETKTPYRIAINWDLKAMGPGATGVSSAGDGDAELPAGPVSRLQRSTFMAGHLTRDPVNAGKGNFSAAWSGDPGFDLHAPMQWAAKLHGFMTTFFQTPNDPAYRVFIRLNGAGNPGGGVAFPNSFFATYGGTVTGDSMKGILGHEMTHTFTANGLGKWYDEGDAVYYQVRLPWLAGMVPTETYLRDINLTAARYYTNAEIHSPEERIIPNFFSNPWLNTLGYDRGALYFAILNGKIKRATGGKRSVDDLVRVLVKKQRAGEEIVEADWVDLIRKEIGEDAVAVHKAMMSGEGIMIPESDDYGPCFRRISTKIRRYDLGFKPKSLPDRKTEITELLEGSEAAKAGLKNGDVVTLSTITTEGVKRDPAALLTVTMADGRAVKYLPRGEAFDAYQWERVPNVPESACKV